MYVKFSFRSFYFKLLDSIGKTPFPMQSNKVVILNTLMKALIVGPSLGKPNFSKLESLCSSTAKNKDYK